MRRTTLARRSSFEPCFRCHPRGITARLRRRGNGFTLVELLVVIGIIALLVSILLPSLSRTREQARSAQCLSNLRQLSMAIVNYTNDNQYLMLGGADGEIAALPWDWVCWGNSGGQYNDLSECSLAKYLGINTSAPVPVPGDNPSVATNVFRCPSDQWQQHVPAADAKTRPTYYFMRTIKPLPPRMALATSHFSMATPRWQPVKMSRTNITGTQSCNGRYFAGLIPAARARAAALSVFSQLKAPSAPGGRPKWP
jgi:prepilin-type N-terminal cleavage/methylation domain-containing protein